MAYEPATILAAHDLDAVGNVREALRELKQQDASPVKQQWLALPGQSSGLTWTYFLTLCGVPGVKADRMVVRYVSLALGEPVSGEEAEHLVGHVARNLGTSEIKLDHTIWRYESGREIYLRQ